MYESTNIIKLCGKVSAAPFFSHQSHGERFMSFPLSVKRLSDNFDTLNVLINESMLSAFTPTSDSFVSVKGELRSFNNKSGVGNRLVIAAFAKEASPIFETEYTNNVSLTGVICKQPIYRRTPLGREICDLMLAINRRYGRADYIPCIAWGKNAQTASAYSTGTEINISGRLQSRNYIKIIDNSEMQKTTYEVSVTSISTEWEK